MFSAPISSSISIHLKWELLNNLAVFFARDMSVLTALIIVGSSLKTSFANDGPIKVTRPSALSLIICFIVADQTLLVLGFKPLATLIIIGVFFKSLTNLYKVSSINIEGTANKI